jgi:hypothetical protein
MQADLAVGAMVDRFRASVSLGYVHEGALAASVTHGEEDRLISRQHWAGFVFGESDAFMLRAGRMNLPFGLRVAAVLAVPRGRDAEGHRDHAVRGEHAIARARRL